MTENTCNCDEFKKALEKGSGDDAYFAAIWSDKTTYEIAGETINFCPWCGKNAPQRKEQNE